MSFPSYYTLITSVAIALAYVGLVQGIFLAFRVLNFPDLTVNGSLPLGAAMSILLLERFGWGPLWTLPLVFLAGAAAGLTTALLTTKMKINGLLASILVATGLYSINLRLLGFGSPAGRPNGTLYVSEEKGKAVEGLLSFLPLRDPEKFSLVALLVGGLLALLVWGLLSTQLGLAVRATGNNEQMARAVGIDTDLMKIIGLACANGLVAISGAMLAQRDGYASADAGLGAIVFGLAGLILGEAVVRSKLIGWAILSTLVGSIIYRVVLAVVLAQNLETSDQQLITALLVAIALALPLLRGRLPGFASSRVAATQATANDERPAGKLEG